MATDSYRTLADYRRLREWTARGQRFAVIGGGFIGSEIAAALAMNHKEVVMLFPGRAICERLFPADLAEFVNSHYRQQGVELWPGESANGLERREEKWVLKTQSRRELVCDGVVSRLNMLADWKEPHREGVIYYQREGRVSGVLLWNV
jgi:3-phenylpropionate/trans-cinnamate dioxygenase ferredoxin reductase component